MLNDEFKLLIISNKILENSNTLISKCETPKIFLGKIFNVYENYYSYIVNNNVFKFSIKDGGKKLFHFLNNEAQTNKDIYLIIYDEREVTYTVNENYKKIIVKDNSQCYDFIYRLESHSFGPLTIYKFV